MVSRSSLEARKRKPKASASFKLSVIFPGLTKYASIRVSEKETEKLY
jgi:hypothetical protein